MRKKENLSVNNPAIGPHPRIDEDAVRKALHKIKKGKTSGSFGFVS